VVAQLNDKFPAPPATLSLISGKLPKGWEHFEIETVKDALKGVYVSWPIVLAIKALLANPEAFLTDYGVFENTAMVFSASEPNFGELEVCTPAEILWTASCVHQMTGVKPAQYGPQVVTYIRACMVSHGLYAYPDQLAALEDPENKALRDEIRKARSAGHYDLESDDMTLVQAAKLQQTYTEVEVIALRFSDQS
jgi:hypothetical protein